MRIDALKVTLLIIWAAWLTVALITNACDAMKTLQLLPEDWRLASGNYRFLCDTTARYGIPDWLNALLFSGVLGWEALAALLFWKAGWASRGSHINGTGAARLAFAVSLPLWGAFLFADEIFIAYDVEGTHLRIFMAQLATFLVVELVSDRSAPMAS